MNLIRFFKTIIDTTSDAQALISNEQKTGEELDRRLEDVAKATMDGENEWFLRLVKKNPDCAIEIIRECDINDTKLSS